MRRIIIHLSLCLIMSGANASAVLDIASSITQISSSGNSIVLDIGKSELVKDEGDIGILIKPVKGMENSKVLKNVALIKLVKSYHSESVWIIAKRYSTADINTDTRYILLTQSQLLRGRKEYEFSRTEVVTDYDDKTIDQIKEALTGEDSHLSMKDEDYVVNRILHEKEKYYKEDVNLVDVSEWDHKQTKSIGRTSIYRSPHSREFSTKKRLDTFEKMLANSIEKSAQGFDPDAYYRGSTRGDDGSSELESLYSPKTQKHLGQNGKMSKKQKFMTNVSKKGAGWSNDYSDEELADVVDDMGLHYELYRQKQVVANRYRYQLFAGSGFNIIQNQTSQDPDNASFFNYDIEAGAEFFPFKHHEDLNRFTAGVNGRYSTNTISVGDYNASVTEFSAALDVNWYPMSHPNSVNENVPFLGLLFRTGLASVNAPELGETASYQLYTKPGFKAGIKYNFPTGWSLRFTGTFEKIILDRLKSNNTFTNLPTRSTLTEGKIAIAIMKYYE